MWIIDLVLTGIEILVEIFSSKKSKVEKRRETGKRYNKKVSLTERIRRIDNNPNSTVKWEDIRKDQ